MPITSAKSKPLNNINPPRDKRGTTGGTPMNCELRNAKTLGFEVKVADSFNGAEFSLSYLPKHGTLTFSAKAETSPGTDGEMFKFGDIRTFLAYGCYRDVARVIVDKERKILRVMNKAGVCVYEVGEDGTHYQASGPQLAPAPIENEELTPHPRTDKAPKLERPMKCPNDECVWTCLALWGCLINEGRVSGMPEGLITSFDMDPKGFHQTLGELLDEEAQQ